MRKGLTRSLLTHYTSRITFLWLSFFMIRVDSCQFADVFFIHQSPPIFANVLVSPLP